MVVGDGERMIKVIQNLDCSNCKYSEIWEDSERCYCKKYDDVVSTTAGFCSGYEDKANDM